MDDPKTLGDHLRNRRLDLGLLQGDVANMLGTTVLTICNWEVNRSSPQLRFIPAVNAFLGHDAYSTQGETLGERLALATARRTMVLVRRARHLHEKRVLAGPGTTCPWHSPTPAVRRSDVAPARQSCQPTVPTR